MAIISSHTALQQLKKSRQSSSSRQYLRRCEECVSREIDIKNLKLEDFAVQVHLNRSKSRKQLLQILSREVNIEHDDAEDVPPWEKILDLVIRMWLFVNVTDRNHWQDFQQTQPVSWRREESIDDLIARLFPKTDAPQSRLATSLSCQDINVENAEKYVGLSIKPTSSLEDHLRLRTVDGHRELRVFRHASWLRESIANDDFEPLLPRDLLYETLMTLDLLFSTMNSRRHTLATEHEYELLRVAEFAPIEIRSYPYWGERLQDLFKEIHGPPRTFGRAIKDTRNPLIWWTFFLALAVALLTLIFGIVATVLAALQLKATANGNGG